MTSNSKYLYLGNVKPFAGSSLGKGFVYRLWADWLEYEYTKDNIDRHVKAPGVEAAVGYQDSSEKGWWGIFTGLAYRHSRISPDDASSPVRGGTLGPKLQLEGERTFGDIWRLSGNASYMFGQKSYWGRARLMRGELGNYRFGVEAIAMGDPDYQANQYGGIVILPRINRVMELGFKAGSRQGSGVSAQPYFGLEVGLSY